MTELMSDDAAFTTIIIGLSLLVAAASVVGLLMTRYPREDDDLSDIAAKVARHRRSLHQHEA